MNTKKVVFIVLGVVAIISVIAFGFIYYNNKELTDSQILNKFNCSRTTSDAQETDIYCKFPELYRTGVITDEEISKFYLGCDKAQANSVAFSICSDKKFFEQYKTNLLATDQRLKSQGCSAECTTDPRQ